MSTYLLTGGSGFLGTLLKHKLLADGHEIVNVDLHPDEDQHTALRSFQLDIADHSAMKPVFEQNQFDGIFHVAAMLAHAVNSRDQLIRSNVNGTQVIAELARRHKVPNLVFTSSNCLWGTPRRDPISEEDEPEPVEIYGQSKWDGEKVLAQYASDLNIVCIRCPTIIDSGRLGLLAILFDFIHEGKRVWTVGSGDNRYQFIYAQDLIDAAIRSIHLDHSATFNIGSDDVTSLRQTYEYIIRKAKSQSRVSQLPRAATLAAMRLAHTLNVSPLGPYHYKMISESFEFDTRRIKSALDWRPTLSNEEMLWKAYTYYAQHREVILGRSNVSAHRQQAQMGIIRLLKWIS